MSNETSPQQPAHLPFWLYDAPPRMATFVKRGSRIGLALAAGLELLLTAVAISTGAIADLFLAELVPGLDVMLDCLTLLVAIFLAVAGFYLGSLIGSLVYLAAYARWKSRQKTRS